MEVVQLPSRTEPIGKVERIKRVVALSYGINPKHMASPSRCRRHAWPRQVAMYLAREMTDKSLCHLAQLFGKRDHTTVIYALRQVEKRMAEIPVFREDVEALREGLTQ